MREIKFRAMTLPPKDFADYHFNSEMVYGTGVFFDGFNYWLYAHEACAMANDFSKWIIKPETMGQFTGFRDKNGKEIYEESDVLCSARFPKGTMCQYTISFENGSYRKHYLPRKDVDYAAVITQYEIDLLEVEIIGNIHENPEIVNATTS